jgi:hypothetical protein
LKTRLALALLLAAAGPAAAQMCATDPRGWCAAPAGDRCGRHRDAASCRADPECYGMPYRGESVVACRRDARGFGLNCPTVGCASAPSR